VHIQSARINAIPDLSNQQPARLGLQSFKKFGCLSRVWLIKASRLSG
jgi:hypothetical protein